MTCPRCSSTVSVDGLRVVTCFMCGATLAFKNIESERELVKQAKTAKTAKAQRTHGWHAHDPMWKRLRVCRERIVALLARGHERKWIAARVGCSRTLVDKLARENGFRVYERKRQPGGRA